MTISEITKSSNNSLRIKELSSLRGLFMITIFLHHLGLYEGGAYMAVSFFFVLSGYSLTLGYYNKIINSQFSYKSFIIRRFARLYPVHWLCFFVILPLYLTAFLNEAGLYKLIPNLLLMQSLFPVMDVYFSYNAVSWYLSDIFIMAIFFPIIIKLFNMVSQSKRVALISLFITVYFVAVKILPLDLYHALLYINPFFRMIDFVIGIILGLLFVQWKNNKEIQKRNKSKRIQYIVLGLSSFITMILLSVIYETENPLFIAAFYWLPVSLLIFSVSAINILGGGFILTSKCLVYLGEISLSFFMFHQIIIRYAGIIFSKLFHTSNLTHPILIILIFIVVVFVSHLSNKYFERPIFKWITTRG